MQNFAWSGTSFIPFASLRLPFCTRLVVSLWRFYPRVIILEADNVIFPQILTVLNLNQD